ncbi:MAG: TetR/AcrR family transcriptional regulator [Actinomycetota bacterium]
MARPPASAEDRERERRRLRRAALEVYREGGVAAVTVRAVTKRAGVSSGTLYNFFPSVTELLRSLYLEPIRRSGERLADVVEAHPDPVERVHVLLTEYVSFMRRFPEIHRGVLLFVRPASIDPPEIRPPTEIPFFRHLRDAIDEGIRTGAIDSLGASPDDRARLIWASLHGALALPVNLDGSDIDPDGALADAMVDHLVAGLRVG